MRWYLFEEPSLAKIRVVRNIDEQTPFETLATFSVSLSNPYEAKEQAEKLCLLYNELLEGAPILIRAADLEEIDDSLVCDQCEGSGIYNPEAT